MTAYGTPLPPVLIIGFNRPTSLERVLQATIEASPPRIYVALDGPRSDMPSDVDSCAATRSVAERYRREGYVTLLSQPENLGCGHGVTAAVDWFFEHEDAGAILEDDCLPSPQFFDFCGHLLERYRDDPRVWMVAGANLLGRYGEWYGDYFFSDGGVWGWATWRDRWAHADLSMSSWEDPGARDRARSFLGEREWQRVKPVLASVFAGEIDTWDYQWLFTCASNNGLAAIPSGNLITNIGFGHEATHTTEDAPIAQLPWQPVSIPPTSSAPFTPDRRYMELKARRHRRPLRMRISRRVQRVYRSVRR